MADNISNLNGGTLVRDGAASPVQIGGSFQTADAKASPVTSPVTFTSTQTIIVPKNAVEMALISPSNNIGVSEVSNSASYFTLPKSTNIIINCARMSSIYLTEASGGTIVSFYFTII